VRNIRLLADITRHDTALAGGKGANLGELTRLGLPVPNAFVVLTRAYAEHAARWGLSEALRPLILRQDWAELEKEAARILTAGSLDPQLQDELSECYLRLDSPRVAVRSSATAEDRDDASFAGQQETFLDLCGGDELVEAVRKCWASLWTRRAVHYRHRRSIDHLSVHMAVVVQEMVSPGVFGVLLTVDPVAGRDDRILIEVHSRPGGVVSGSVTGERYEVDRELLTLVDPKGSQELLSREQVTELCRLALEIEKHFGDRQDIEFAVARDKVHLLQARPITANRGVRPEPLPALEPPSFLDRVMKPIVNERYVVAPRPLDNLVYTRMVGAALYMIRQSGGVVSPENEAAFRSIVWRQAYRFPPVGRLWKVMLSSLVHPFLLLNRDWQAWWEGGPRDAIRASSAPVDLSVLDDDALVKRADRILAAWEEPVNRRFDAARAIQVESYLRLVLTLAVGRRERDRVLGTLLAGIQNPTVEVNDALWELSRLARRSAAVLEAVRRVEPETLESTPEGRAFLGAFREFIDRYGHRESSCWYLSTPTWRRDPFQVWRLLSSLVRAETRSARPAELEARYREARGRVERRLRFFPGLSRWFGWMVDGLRRFHGFRESSHFDLSRPLDALQEIAWEWGRRLTHQGLLENNDDVFYLTPDEVREWLLGPRPPCEKTHRLVARRRATYQVANARWQEERYHDASRGGELSGIPVSPGVAVAEVRVIRGEHEFDLLQPGEVLVCPYTNPAWTPLFAAAAAVVAETGGATSHAAIVAREYGIPAVMAVRAATRLLRNGQEILVDGNRGRVRRGDS
jgi:phosphohistidine swiveling domain-containing protein